MLLFECALSKLKHLEELQLDVIHVDVICH